jgi:hypothetical protein
MNKRLTELMEKADLELLNLYVAAPQSQEAQGADTILRYRQYLAQKSYNKLVVVLTVVLALSTTAQAVLTWVSATHAAERQTSQKSESPDVIAVELDKIRETLDGMRRDLKGSDQVPTNKLQKLKNDSK